uniref:Uncharacterized protein n=1 Tax=Lepeophtheirus salmonis TaxID=72036 RepID=A0A0K2V8U9_LEPSM
MHMTANDYSQWTLVLVLSVITSKYLETYVLWFE